MKALRDFDWEASAGIVAAVVALVLHLLHVVDLDVLFAITLVILALILIGDLRREGREERVAAFVERNEAALRRLQSALAAPQIPS